jgi:hypothetical protein
MECYTFVLPEVKAEARVRKRCAFGEAAQDPLGY